MNIRELNLNELDKNLSEEERREWNSIYASFRAGSLLTGTVSGMETRTIDVKNDETGEYEEKIFRYFMEIKMRNTARQQRRYSRRQKVFFKHRLHYITQNFALSSLTGGFRKNIYVLFSQNFGNKKSARMPIYIILSESISRLAPLHLLKTYLRRSNRIPMSVLGWKTPLQKRQELEFARLC